MTKIKIGSWVQVVFPSKHSSNKKNTIAQVQEIKPGYLEGKSCKTYFVGTIEQLKNNEPCYESEIGLKLITQ